MTLDQPGVVISQGKAHNVDGDMVVPDVVLTPKPNADSVHIPREGLDVGIIVTFHGRVPDPEHDKQASITVKLLPGHPALLQFAEGYSEVHLASDMCLMCADHGDDQQ